MRTSPDTTADLDFLRTLLHDDRSSRYATPCKTKGGWRSGRALPKEALIEKYARGRYGRRDDQYVSVCGFTGCDRAEIHARQVNALFIDIDCHDKTGASLHAFLGEVKAKLFDAIAVGVLVSNPKLLPTYVVETGRGLQVWYILDRSIPVNGSTSSRRALALRKKLFSRLNALFFEILNIAPDEAVSDLARVGRIPGTFNTRAGVYAKTIFSSGVLCNMASSMKALDAFFKDEADTTHTPKHFRITNFNPILHDREAALCALRDARKCAGVEHLRKETLFAYAEVVVRQYCAADACALVESFNAAFACPLSPREVASTFKSARGRLARGFKVYGASRLSVHLQLSADEAALFFGNSTARSVARAQARERKEKRNARIDEMLARGASYSVVAKAVGCTKQTVYNYVRRLKSVGREVAEGMVELKAACRKALDAARTKTSIKSPSNGSVRSVGMTTFLRIHRFDCSETSFAGNNFARAAVNHALVARGEYG